jgi:hypothetical protein
VARGRACPRPSRAHLDRSSLKQLPRRARRGFGTCGGTG